MKGLIFILCMGVFAPLSAQDLRLSSYLEEDFSKLAEALDLQKDKYQDILYEKRIKKEVIGVSSAFIPEFVRKNPTGYTYLCRLELQIEKDLPLGLWLDIGDDSTYGNPSNANANVRFRFKLNN
ncbi:MAG: hypothetical protein AAFR87_21340 [Bacteroidota bacterium]